MILEIKPNTAFNPLLSPNENCTKRITHLDLKPCRKAQQMISDLFYLGEEVVDHVFDLRSLGGEQNQLLGDQVELQHVLGGD